MEKRYHVHVCFATDDLVVERSIMMQKLATQCFFTWSLHDNASVTTNYSRQQIDACDYVIFLVGGIYGSLAASGVSYLHLDFIYANTKQKPMVALILDKKDIVGKPSDVSEHNKRVYNMRKLVDFKKNLIATCPNCFEFGSNVDFANKLATGFTRLTEDFPRLGWTPTKESQPITSYKATPENTGEFSVMGIDKKQLQDTLVLTYRVQAFKDGNFKELLIEKQIAWGDLLNIVADAIRMPANEDIIAKVIHEFLDENALNDVHKVMPEAHAAARSQLSPSTIQTIKLQFAANDWLSATDFTTTGKKLLILTPQGARQVTQWRGVVERMRAFN